MSEIDQNTNHEESPYKGKSGLTRIWNALFYSLDGLATAYKNESAFRQEVWLGVVALPIACFVPASLTQKALLLGCVFLVLLTELLNSAVEATVDRISLENHKLAKRAKDIGSAAVLMALLNFVCVWSLVLIDVYR